MDMSTVEVRGYGKINLSLDVIGKRPNGFHELRMIMQTVDVYDVITLEAKEEQGIELTLDVPGLEADESNLCYKAAAYFMERYPINKGVRIHLQKNIPMAAGMAGGSADAAAVLKGMNELFGMGASFEELCEIGVKCGSDVPYCILGGTALAEGIGEVLTPLPDAPDCNIVLCKPDFDMPTPYVYKNLHYETLTYHPDVDGMIRSIHEGNLLEIGNKMGNVLETVTEREHKEISDIKAFMRKEGAFAAMMTGSGPTVFGLCDSLETARKVADGLKERFPSYRVMASSFYKMNG